MGDAPRPPPRDSRRRDHDCRPATPAHERGDRPDPDGQGDTLLAELRRFTAATPAERRIATLFSGSMDDTRRLTGGDPARTATIVAIADLLLKRLRKPQHVDEFLRTELSPGSGDRIVDRVLDGDEPAVLAELKDGRIDVDALRRDAMILYYRW